MQEITEEKKDFLDTPEDNEEKLKIERKMIPVVSSDERIKRSKSIYKDYNAGMTKTQMMKKYNLTRKQIYNIYHEYVKIKEFYGKNKGLIEDNVEEKPIEKVEEKKTENKRVMLRVKRN